MKTQVCQKPASLLLYLLITTAMLLSFACSRSDEESPGSKTEPPVPATTASVEIPVTTTSETARALYAEGEYFVDVGRVLQAREKFLAAATADPSFALAYYGLSNAAISYTGYQNSLDTALEYAEGISDGERLLIEINRSFLSNDAADGLALAQELVDKFPTSARARIVLAGMQADQKDNKEARASYQKALELEANVAGALAGLARNHLFSEPKDFAAAESWANQLIAAYPEEARAYDILGDIKRAQNNLEAALEAYILVSQLDPASEIGAIKRGHINSFLGNIEEARSNYDEAIALASPENKAGSALSKGFTNIYGGDIPAAIDEFEALTDEIVSLGTPADQVKGYQVYALNNAAFAAMYVGLFERAESIVSRRNALAMAIAEDIGTDNARRLQTADCRFYDGLQAAFKGDIETAAKHAEAIVLLLEGDENPRKLEGAHWVLGKSALQTGDFATAVEQLRQADYSRNILIRYQLALAEQDNGNAEEARKLFNDVAIYNMNTIGFALVGKEAAAKVN